MSIHKVQQNELLNQLLTQNFNLHGRRIVGAGRSQRSTDYVIQEELSRFDYFINVKDSPFYAKGDNSHADAVAISNALQEAAATDGKAAVFIPRGNYLAGFSLEVPSKVWLFGVANFSKIISTIPQGDGVELITLAGDHARISDLNLYGIGQAANTPDGNRGIWIGAADHVSAANFCKIENVLVEQFTGNGLSGVYVDCEILNSIFRDNTDANVFVPPQCGYNLFQGLTLLRSKYSGMDVNGSNNRIIGCNSRENGGGSADQASWSGFFVAPSGGDTGSKNIFTNCYAEANKSCGFRSYGNTTGIGSVRAPYGNKFIGCIAKDHTTAYDDLATRQTEWTGGFCLLGGHDNAVKDCFSIGNTHNYVGAGFPSDNSLRTKFIDNISLNAVTSASLVSAGKPSGIGYFFPGAARIDGTGGNPASGVIFKGNTDAYAAKDGVRLDLAGAGGTLLFENWTMSENQIYGAGAYGFNFVAYANILSLHFDDSNFSDGAATSDYNNVPFFGLAQNSATPSVKNIRFCVTQNTSDTTITNLLNGIPGRSLTILVQDNHSIFDFTGSNLVGNSGVKFKASIGDSIIATLYNGKWYCTVYHVTGAPVGQSNGVAQGSGSGKGTTVTNDYVKGQITLDSASLAANTTIAFQLNNAMILATSDQVEVRMIGGPDYDKFYPTSSVTGVGTANISIRNTTAGALSGNQVVGFEVIHQA